MVDSDQSDEATAASDAGLKNRAQYDEAAAAPGIRHPTVTQEDEATAEYGAESAE
jgi:hypothetical protein